MNMQLDPSVKAIRVGLNWNSNEENVLDLDLSVFLLDDAYLARGDGDYVFYNNAVSENGAVFSKQIKIPPGFKALKQFLTAASLVARSK